MASNSRPYLREDKYKPAPRYLHTAEAVGCRTVLYNGMIQDLPGRSISRFASNVNIFNHALEQWEEKELTGDTLSRPLRGAASASLGSSFYFFGGHDCSVYNNNLFRISCQDNGYQCSKLSSSVDAGPSSCPMPKFGAGLIAFGDSLGVFGGFGTPNGPIQPGSSFINSSDSRGWTNEFHVYNLKEGINYQHTLLAQILLNVVCISFYTNILILFV